MRNLPAPTNLQVLPKNLTGDQVHDIMEGFAGSLGVHCDFCHAADPRNLIPTGARASTSPTTPRMKRKLRA